MKTGDEILKELEEKLSAFSTNPKIQNVGVVERNTDGVIQASGLSKVQMGEIVEFQNGEKGVILKDRKSVV